MLVMLEMLAASSLACAPAQDEAPWPTHGWHESTPAEQGLDPAPLAELDAAFERGDYGNVDRVVVVSAGHLVVDRRYARDYRAITRGRKSYIGYGEGAEPDPGILPEFNYFDPATHPFYGGRDVHTLQSVTKSISSALIGIAIGRGEIDGVDVPLLSFFGDYDLSKVDPRLRRATLEDLLTMRTGIEWHETDRPYGDANTTSSLERAHDWIRFTLDQPMDANPGEKWAYNSGGSQLMSGVLEDATGKLADEYAQQHLFGPLGIEDYHWKKTPAGYPDTLGGLYLAAEQLAKIGYLYLHDGIWDGRRILPRGWVEASTRRHVERISPRSDRGYGYQWWRVDRDGVVVWAGLGFGGQYLLVLPDRDVVGVVSSWNIFGRRVRPVLAGFLDALIAASGPDERPAKSGEWGFRPAAGSTATRNPPPFSWRPQRGAKRYELQASRDPRFARVDYRATGVRFNVHCPPRAFEPGEWSWRFRVTEGDGSPHGWSTSRTFTVPADARRFVLPPRDELLARIPEGHPRLFVRPEDLPRLIELAKGSQAGRFARLVEQCERLLEKPPPSDEPPRYPAGTVRKSEEWRAIWWGNRQKTIQVLDSAATLAFTWRLGGRREFAELARRLLLDAAAWDPKGATGYRYNDEAGMPFAYHFSRAYTFLYPLLSEQERAACRDVMRVRGREMYAHLAPRHLWQPYSSHSNRAWHFLGEVGIAFHGEIPEAGDWVDFAVNVFANVYPVWSDADGGWHEGTAYWRSYLQRFTWWADVQKAALGIDAYELPFFSEAGNYAMYLMPPGTEGGGFGDLNAAKVAAGNRPLMSILASQAGDAHWRWYVDQLGGPDFGGGYVGFLRGVAPTVEARPPIDLPTSRAFRGTGQAVLNTDLGAASDNVEVIFKSSPFGTQSHGYEAQNAFLLYAYGERLLIRSGKRDIYGSEHHTQWMWQTKSVNSITLGGKGQGVHTRDAVGRITDFHTEPGFHEVEGEARDAYGGRLESFRRRIVLLEPDLVLVIDRLRAKDPTPMEWHLHAPVPFEPVQPNAWIVRNGAAACRIRFLAPERLAFAQTDRFDPPPRARVRLVEHHLTASIDATGDALFVTLIRPFRARAKPPALATMRRGPQGEVVSAPLGDGRAEVLIGSRGTIALRRFDAGGKVVFER